MVLLGVIVLVWQCVGLLWCCGLVGIWLVGLWIECGWLGNEGTRTRVLPSAKRLFFNRILTAAPIPIIQFPVYSTVKTVYQIEPKKIG